ncbi:MAG: CotH kinase family protein [Roseburia sp.]|nr:CotH kinase family protein [Roseburia sp.]
MKKIAWFLCVLAACFSIVACSHTSSSSSGGGSGNNDSIGGGSENSENGGGSGGGSGGGTGGGGSGSGVDFGGGYVPSMKADNTLYIHYLRDDADYEDWHVWHWGQTGVDAAWYEAVGTDASGAVYAIQLNTPVNENDFINFIVAKGEWEEKDVKPDCTVRLADAGKVDKSYHWFVEKGKSDMGNGSLGGQSSNVHEHTYDMTTWGTDANYHWRKATCDHKDKVKDKAPHTFNGNTCTICAYVRASQGDGEVKIVFDAGSGEFSSGDSTVTVRPDSDGKVDIFESPKSDGCAFAGWYNSSNVKFDADTVYSTSQTFTAKYMVGSGNGVYTALFDPDSTVSVKIDMSDAEWRKLNNDIVQNRKSDIYRKADSVTVGITTDEGRLDYYYEEVGVRLKGNTSRHDFYGSNGFYQSVHFKLSFGETFDDVTEYSPSEIKTWNSSAERKARKNRTFATLEKLDIKYNATKDESYVRELFAFKTFRDNGIAAPQATLGALTAKNKNDDFINLGVYRIMEPVDKIFIQRNFPGDDTGDLYKCTWTSMGSDFTTTENEDGCSLIGVEDVSTGKFYTYDKKTNKKALDLSGNADVSSMSDFIHAVNSASAAGLAQYIDIDLFAKFEAVNYLLGNPDCIRNNKNNFYTYFRPSDGKAVFIPFDYDRCLGVTYQWDPSGDACTGLSPYTTRTATRNWSNGQKNPIYIKLIDRGAPYGSGSALMKYRDNLIALKNSSAITASAFSTYMNAYKSKYESVASNAIAFNDKISNNLQFGRNDGGNMSYSEYITKKLNTLNSNLDNYS